MPVTLTEDDAKDLHVVSQLGAPQGYVLKEPATLMSNDWADTATVATTSPLPTASDHRADQLVHRFGEALQVAVAVVDPTRLDPPRQVPERGHPVARRRRPTDHLYLDISRMVLHHFDRPHALNVAVDDGHRCQPFGGCAAPLRRPRATRG